MIHYLSAKKRLAVTLLSTAALSSLSLSSCRDYDAFDEGEYQKVLGEKDLQTTVDEFSKNFIARFGQPDPNHTWGMGPISGDSETRGQVANKNEWDQVYHLVVPGWPDTYYKEGDNTLYGSSNYNNYVGNKSVAQSSAGSVPAGDVTDEEIQYVSWWFRTHRYPTSIETHWSDFYIQEVSSDFDRDVDGNKVTKAPIFKRNDTSSPWVLDGYRDLNNGINHLQVKAKDDVTVINPDPVYDEKGNLVTPEAGYAHIYNFNSGSSNKMDAFTDLPMWNEDPYRELGTHTTDYRMIAFYQSVGTEDFKAHYSNDDRYRSNYLDKKIWVLVHLHFVGESGRIYDGYYLGFDYAFFMTNNEDRAQATEYVVYEPDGYYSNWIVKLSPGKPLENSSFTRRVMCEDLGNTFDFDFDDVVFDATYNIESTSSYHEGDDVDVTIRLQAAGGTMPIVVGKNPNGNVNYEYEAHKLFGYDYTVPVNVDKNLGVSGVVNYHITVNSLAPKDIPIWVYNTKKSQWYNINNITSAYGNYNPPAQPDPIKSIVPQTFAVPSSVLWLKETHQIEAGYENFGKWAQNQNSDYGEEGATPWYVSPIHGEHLCGFGGVSSTPSGLNPDSGMPGTTSSSQGYTHTVTVLVNNKGWGTVTADGVNTTTGYGVYDTKSSKQLTLTAVPADGYVFDYWNVNGYGVNNDNISQGNRTITNSTITINVDKEKTVFAVFKPAGGGSGGSYTLNFTGTDLEISIVSVNGNTPTGSPLKAQDKVILSHADVPSGKVFLGWYQPDWQDIDYLMSTNDTYEVTMNEPEIKVKAKIADLYELPISVSFVDEDGETTIPYTGNQNTVVLNNDQDNQKYSTTKITGIYNCAVGQSFQYYIVMDDLYDVYLNDVKLETFNNNFTVESDSQFNIRFQKKPTPYTINANSEGNGSVTGGGTYYKNGTATLTATPNTGYTFDGWYEGEVQISRENPFSFTVTGDRTIKAIFTEEPTSSEG